MKRSFLDIVIVTIIFLMLAAISIYIVVYYCGVKIQIAPEQISTNAFYIILIKYGACLNLLGFITFLAWYFLSPKLYRLESLRFNMRSVWFVYLSTLVVLASIISATMKWLIVWESSASYGLLAIVAYPASCAVGFWISSALFSPTVVKYVPVLSKQTRWRKL